MEMSTSPDCRAGKHRACTGEAWDHDRDEPASCGCDCHRETVRVGGLGATLVEVAEAFSASFRDLTDALFGYPVKVDDRVEPGHPRIHHDGRTRIMHTFDLLAITHRKDYAARLTAVAEHISDEADRKAHEAISRMYYTHPGDAWLDAELALNWTRI